MSLIRRGGNFVLSVNARQKLLFFQILKTLLFYHGILGIFALPPVEVKSPSDVEIIPNIEASISSEDAKPEARFFFTQAFTTSYQTIGTSTLSTYP